MSRPFWNRNLTGLVFTQYLGAFNDNFFKQLILILAGLRLFGKGHDNQGPAAVAFALPFVLFSGIVLYTVYRIKAGRGKPSAE